MRNWYVEERSARNDSVTLWLKSQSLLGTDTLRIAAKYLKRDKNGVESEGSDTLRFVVKHNLRRDAAKAIAEKEKRNQALIKRGEKPDTAAVLIKLNPVTSNTLEMGSRLVIDSPVPLNEWTLSASKLEQKRDSLWVEIADAPKLAVTDSLKPRRYTIDYPWKYNTTYRISVDSLSATSIYGTPLASLRHEFKTREENEYSSITFDIRNLDDSIGYFVQLLDKSGKPLRTSQLTVRGGQSKITFSNLLPNTYMARIYEDYNSNGRFDPGDYDTHTQPDQCLYFPQFINLKKNWSKEESWDPYATPVDQQRPKEQKEDSEARTARDDY